MIVRLFGWFGAVIAAIALAAPAGACSSMIPQLTRVDGQPLRSVEDAVRDAGLVAEGEVIRIGTVKICAPSEPTDCRDFPSTLIFRIDTPYKGALDPVVEVEPLGGCAADGSGGIWDGLVPVGTRLLLTAEIMPDLMEPMSSTVRYHQTDDFVNIQGNSIVGVPLSEWERYRRLWMDLEARAAAHPGDPQGWRDLAHAMDAWRDYPRALKAYDRLAALLPQDLDIQASRGRLMFYLRMPEAEAVLSRVVKERPSDAKSRSLLALLRYRPGATSSLTGLDLSNTDLRGRSFTDVDFSGSNFSGADLRGYAELENVNLAEANLSRAKFFDGYPLDHIYPTSLRNADFTDSYFEDIPAPSILDGAKLSGVVVPVKALGDLNDHADLSGARIICSPIPKAKYWQVASFHSQRETWQDHIDELKDANHAVQEQPAALLDASCSEAIRDHLHESCTPWILEAKRSPGCKIALPP